MHPPDSFAPYPSQPAVNPWLIRLPVLAVSGVVLVVAALVVLVLGVQFLYNDKIIPGVSALGLNLGGLTRAQALAVLESHFTYDDEAVFTFRYGDRFWQLRAAELGVTFDADATLNDALAAGHNNNFAADLVAQANIWLNGQSVAPVVRYDQALTIGHLVAIANDINQPSKDATLVLNGAMVTTTPG